MTNPDAQNAKSWPFEQARALLKRVGDKKLVTFQTGFGPSGAPHIGTFGEVTRTQMVRDAFIELTGGTVATRLIVFSDDYDGFRKVPDGMPESMAEHLGKPLTMVPDPFGEYESFAHRNNAALKAFIEQSGFEDVELISATECYRNGVFDDVLQRVLLSYDAVQAIMLPTLRDARKATYSAFMPLAYSGVLLADASVRPSEDFGDAGRGLFFKDSTFDAGVDMLIDVRGGAAKLQWKVDWAARWVVFDVDYEMHGKDLMDSAVLSSRICKAIGGKPPMTFTYELFLDDEGRKQSKSSGNGMSMETWSRYSTTGPLAYFMFLKPREAKIFTAKTVPRATDEYLKALVAYPALTGAAKLDSPIWHIHGDTPPPYSSDVTYGLLLNLAVVSGAKDRESLIAYLRQYKALSAGDLAFLTPLIDGAINYARDILLQDRQRRAPTEQEATAFLDLVERFEKMADGLDPEAYQFEVYEVGKAHDFQPLRAWFQSLYEVLFGDEQGPRFGSFTAAYGRQNTIDLLNRAVKGEIE
jgi:lysyl-tRNA synthetase class 1